MTVTAMAITNPRPLSVGRGLVYVFVAAVAWGTGGAVAAVLYRTSGLGPIAVSFWRFATGVVLLAAVARFIGGPGSLASARDLLRGRWGWLIIIGAGLAVYQTAYFAAVQRTGVAVATIVTLGLGPILIAIGAHLTMAERIGRSGVMTIALALLGLALLTGGDATGPAPFQGLALAVLSAVGYAGVTLLTRAMGRRNGGGDQYNLTLLGTAIGMVCLLPVAAFEGLMPSDGAPLRNAALLGYLGAVPTALAYGLFNVGLSSVRATTASVVALMEPVTATVIAVVFLGERMTVRATAGTIAVMAAVVLLAFAEHGRGGWQAAASRDRAVIEP
jgi:DME family drug/metabolite transporter